jgi:hypothetical protein
MFKRNTPEFFYYKLRPFLFGFVKKEYFPDGVLFEGLGKRIYHEGGSGGNDPSF